MEKVIEILVSALMPVCSVFQVSAGARKEGWFYLHCYPRWSYLRQIAAQESSPPYCYILRLEQLSWQKLAVV